MSGHDETPTGTGRDETNGARRSWLSDVAGEWITTWRQRRRWSAERLADECARLGMPELTVSAIKNLESGRPDSSGVRKRLIYIDELWVIAVALRIPWDKFICPYPDRAEMQIAPNASPIPTATVMEWLHGDGTYGLGITFDPTDEAVLPALLLRLHTFLLRMRDDASLNLVDHGRIAANASNDSAQYLAMREELLMARIETIDADLVTLRAQMRARGYPLPALPPALAYVDEKKLPNFGSLVSLRFTFPPLPVTWGAEPQKF